MSKQNVKNSGLMGRLIQNRLEAATLFTDYERVYQSYYNNYQGVPLSLQASVALKRF